MSKETQTQTQTQTEVKAPTNEEILVLVQEYSQANEVEVFTDIDSATEDEGGLIVNIDNGFVEHFESTYPGVNLDEVMSGFFEVLIKGFMQEIEDNPDYAAEIQAAQENIEIQE